MRSPTSPVEEVDSQCTETREVEKGPGASNSLEDFNLPELPPNQLMNIQETAYSAAGKNSINVDMKNNKMTISSHK
jgi:hypothetical protein